MKLSRERPGDRKVDHSQWHDWFAWYPCRAFTAPDTSEQYQPYRWVWLETVERKLVHYVDLNFFVKRVPGSGVP